MDYLVLSLPFLPLTILAAWSLSLSLRRKVPLRQRIIRPGTALFFLLISMLGFFIVVLFGLQFGVEYALRALLLDRTGVSVQAVNGALVAYLSLAIAIALIFNSWHRGRDV